MFTVVKHEPFSFQIPSWLHMLHNIDAINRTMCGHLEQKTLKTTLPMENVILDVIVKTSPLEFQGLINGAFAFITKS
jgi:hypothetical protein